jgi:hypothetical protein
MTHALLLLGIWKKIRDSQLEEGKALGRHVMGSNAYVTSDI